MNEYQKRYYQEHKEKMKATMRDYYHSHKEEYKIRLKKWNSKHPSKVKENSKRSRDKAYRGLGFNPLNKCHKGYEAHHLDNEYVVYIPKKIHRFNWHRMLKPETMTIINMISWDLLESGAY